MKRFRGLVVVAVLAVLPFAIVACNQKNLEAPVAGNASPAPQGSLKVVITYPRRETLRRTVGQPGFIQAIEETPLYAKIPGYIKRWNVDIGDRVRGPLDFSELAVPYCAGGGVFASSLLEGQVLAELWVPEMVQELNQKEALVKQAIAATKVAGAQVATATAQLQEAEAGLNRARANKQRWQIENERIGDLVKRGVVDKQTALETWNQLQAAASTLLEVEAKVASGGAALKESEARRAKTLVDIEAAVADQKRVAALLDYSQLRAPYNGIVTRRTVVTGNFVPSAAATRGEPLFVVARLDKVRIFVAVPETDADWVNKGAPAWVRIQALAGQELPAKVDRTSWSLSPNARTLRAEIDLENSEGRIRPNMYAFATITGERPNVLALPTTCIVTQGDVLQGFQHFCYRVEQGKARKTPVLIGARTDKLVEVVKKQTMPPREGEKPVWEDFTGKEEIIRNDVAALEDGQPITIKP